MKNFVITFDSLVSRLHGEMIPRIYCQAENAENAQERAIDIAEANSIIHGNILSIQLSQP
jgi:hypothetical protein